MSLDSNARRKNPPTEDFWETLKRIRRNEGKCIECGEKTSNGDYCEKHK